MPDFDTPGLIALGAILFSSFFAAFVKGVTTMGLGLVGVPAIAAFLDVQTAVLSLFAAKFVSDGVMMYESKRDFEWRRAFRLRWFVIGGLIAVFSATYLLASLPSNVLYLILGVSVVAFILLQLRNKPITIPIQHEQPWGAVFGAATGVGQGLIGIGAPPTAMYLYSMRLDTYEFVFLSCIVYFLLDIGQLVGVIYFDLYNPTRVFYSVAVFIPVMLGTWAGIRLRNKLSATAFRYSVLGVLFITAIVLIARGVRA